VIFGGLRAEGDYDKGDRVRAGRGCFFHMSHTSLKSIPPQERSQSGMERAKDFQRVL